MFTDKYDLTVSCGSDTALQAYLDGVEHSLGFDRSGIEELQQAVSADDDFALAHVTLAQVLLTYGRRKSSLKHLRKATLLAEHVSAREQSAINVLQLSIRNSPHAVAATQTHVDEYPQDVFVLSQLVGAFGLLSFAGISDWHAKNIDVFEKTKPYYREDDWWHLTMRGFFAVEAGDLARAERECERAWSIVPNGNTAHSLAHLHIESGREKEGREFLSDWIDTSRDQSDMQHHLFWHLSLLDAELGIPVEEIHLMYAKELDYEISDPIPLTTFSDNASFLWRSMLGGVKVSRSDCQSNWNYAERHYPHYGFAFADFHRSMIAALHPEEVVFRECMDKLHAAGETSATRAAACVEACAEGFGAYCKGHYERAADLLGAVGEDSIMVGGSNPQRRIVRETWISACKRADRDVALPERD